MGLEQLNFDGKDKVQFAIELLQAWEPKEGYYLAFSGGKDSVAIYDLAVKAGVKFDAHYCVSPIDPPQIYKFIKEYYPDVIWDYHAKGFWKTVAKKGLPMRNKRWCCRIIKEAGGAGRIVVVGNRRAESSTRSKQCYVESARADKTKTLIRPILNFDNFDIWQYIKTNDLPYCHLYDEGFERLGCVLCPFTKATTREDIYFPKIVKLWRRACDGIVERVRESGYKNRKGQPVKHRFETGEELYQWWVSRK